MEGNNAKILFERYLELEPIGFMYLNFISDGDTKVTYTEKCAYPKASGDGDDYYHVQKSECWNHILKQIREKLFRHIQAWTGGGRNSGY